MCALQNKIIYRAEFLYPNEILFYDMHHKFLYACMKGGACLHG